MSKTKYGVTNQLAQLAKVRSPQPRYNKYGEKIGATGLSHREQMGAAQDMTFAKFAKQIQKERTASKKSKPVMGERMAMNKGGRVKYNKGGMPKAKPC